MIAACRRTEERHRSFLKRSMAYFAMGMALHSEGSYEDVLALISDGLAWAHRGEGSGKLANKAAISHARDRLGPEPEGPAVRSGSPNVRTPGMRWSWLAGRRLVAIDGTCLDLPDTRQRRRFRPTGGEGGGSAFPQARVVALAECGTHAMFDAVVGAYTSSEVALADELIGRLEPGMLLLSDRFLLLRIVAYSDRNRRADLLWRAESLRPEHLRTLDDDSWLALIRPSGGKKAEPITVRVIDYTIEDGRDNGDSYRLFTTILDPAAASATELAAAYAQRWEIELAFDELKTHQRGPRTVLRSKSPELVLQEIWGHLCCHFAIPRLLDVRALGRNRRSSNARCPSGTSEHVPLVTGLHPSQASLTARPLA